MNPSTPFPRCGDQRAVALVLVLAFVVLLTGLTVAFFSGSLLYRQISNSSANEAKVDLFAQGAMDTIVGDLKQEIAAGSNATLYTDTNGNVVGQVYQPFNANTAVPALALKGSSAEQTGIAAPTAATPDPYAPNLVKRSAYQQNFFPAGSDTNYQYYNTGNSSQKIAASATPANPGPTASPHPPSNRAANVATTVPSLNGRSISLARWNKALLLPKANPNPTNDTDFTPINPNNPSTASTPPPVGTNEFVPPDWVLVARDGSNPTGAFSSSMVTSASNTASVVGRYAYTIYDEGGLLDANVAGYPQSSSLVPAADTKYVPYKSAAAFADLTQLPGFSSPGMTLQRSRTVINNLVGWRNYATAQPASGNLEAANGYSWGSAPGNPQLSIYSLAALGNVHGFLKTANTGLFNGTLPLGSNGQTDRMFSSRQEMMRLMLNAIALQGTTAAAVSDQANIQNALQYLGTFSRDVNQPSFAPLPASLTPDAMHRPAVLAPASGGNAYGGLSTPLDDKINPSFLTVRATTTVTGGRNDGSDLSVGEPLVKKRFALSRLAWLTYVGPIAQIVSGTAQYNPLVPASYINALKNTYGFTDGFLLQGTDLNIKKYFGLQWALDTSATTGIGDNQYKWFYNQHLTGPARTPSNAIMMLGDIAALASPREPDFFELLKASIAVGSLGKSFNTSGTELSVDKQIIQIGANIIDQFDLDGFPTRIVYIDGASSSNPVDNVREFAGIENAPYLNSYLTSNFRLELSQPDTTYYYSGYDPARSSVSDGGGRLSGDAPSTDIKYAPSTPTSGSPGPSPVPTMTKPGVTAITLLPELWNPHDQNSTRCALDSSGNPLTDGSSNPLFPTTFRVVAVSAGPPPAAPQAFAVSASNGGGSNRTVAPANGEIDGPSAPFPIYANVSGESAYGGFAPHSRKMTTANSGMYFSVPNTTQGLGLFREPTLLYRVGGTINLSGVDPSGGPSGMPENNVLLNPDSTTDGQFKDGAMSFTSGSGPSDGLLVDPKLTAAAGYNVNFEPRPSDPAGPNKYLGIYIDSIPMGYGHIRHNDPAPPVTIPPTAPTNIKFRTVGQNGGGFPANITILLQCWVPKAVAGTFSATNGQWVTYDQKAGLTGPEQFPNFLAQTGSMMPNNHVSSFDNNDSKEMLDPRTGRLGLSSNTNPFPYLSNQSTTPYWVDSTNGVTFSGRPDYEAGFPFVGGTTAQGFYGNNRYRLFSQNRPDVFDDGRRWVQDPSTAPPSPAVAVYYTDADGVVRRGAGAYAAPTTTTPASATTPYLGLPQTTASSVSGTGSAATISANSNGQSQSRPFILNRPFRSVLELGNVFTGTPWKNLDFFTPESGDAALLDVFCINDTDNVNGLVAGKIDLNTRQQYVLPAILNGGYKDEVKYLTAPPAYSLAPLTSTDATAVANALQRRTGGIGGGPLDSTSGLPRISAPLTNVASLVGTWTSPQTLSGSPSNAASPNNINGSKSYDGLSADLDYITFSNSSPATATIQRFRESALRPLANVGTTRVWNLMIDVVAQTGRYPATAGTLANFIVEGEQRFWVHLSIDRYSGQVIDKQIELVKE